MAAVSDLRPKGIPITLGGEQRDLLFTVNAIDEIQSATDRPVDEVVHDLQDKMQAVKTLRFLMTVLINDDIRRKRRTGHTEEKPLSEEEVGWMLTQDNIVEATGAVLVAYGVSLPEPDEFASPNVESGLTE